MSRRSPGAAAADWVVAIKAARARAVMSVFMGSFHPVTDRRPSVGAAAHRPRGRRLRNGGCHRRRRSPVMQVTLRDDSLASRSMLSARGPGGVLADGLLPV